MTEVEARTKECPIYNTALAAVVQHAADSEGAAEALRHFIFCRGATCMMWRWHEKLSTGGYCGLAGKP